MNKFIVLLFLIWIPFYHRSCEIADWANITDEQLEEFFQNCDFVDAVNAKLANSLSDENFKKIADMRDDYINDLLISKLGND